ncbi:dipeptidase PepV [Haloplasma contractile]|uniref:Succinyl-diaminopimelate desuccinylase protein n=1 Tax=Haloplasma contractile SSD-17B TaxID=1033810 RepID=U2EFA4_9MOLU|nr:dipeptidase PepV [Haloplasma contractile]ERJ13618.1 succinyl-diaminopimelate desuccinylase protein [Haloplasma contractile SSD-17B]
MFNFYEEFEKYHDDFLKKTVELLKIPSVLDGDTASEEKPFGEGIQKAYEYMMNLGEKDGFRSKNIDNYAGHLELGEGDEVLGILCHLDVVPTGDNWNHPPFSGTVKDGKIFARGAIDDKGPTMAAYYAVKMLKDLGVTFNKKVRIIIGNDEESEWRGIDRYLKSEKMPDIGFAPDAEYPLIYGEKGIAVARISGKIEEFDGLFNLGFGERVNVVPDKATAVVDNVNLKDAYYKFIEEKGYKGESVEENKNLALKAFGKNAHAMEPDHGFNAGFILLEFLNERFDNKFVNFMNTYLTYDSRLKKAGLNFTSDVMNDLTCNVGKVVYDKGEFEILLNFRYPHDMDINELNTKFSKIVNQYGFNYEMISNSKPHFVDPNDEFIQTLHNAYIKYTGDEKTELKTIGGGTYARALKKAVAFGALMPGREELAHQPNEYVQIEDLHKSVAIYAEAIYNLTR